MMQPGKLMIPLEVENFLSEQRTTASFAFLVKYSDNREEEVILQNNAESIAFVEHDPEAIYEYRYSADYA